MYCFFQKKTPSKAKTDVDTLLKEMGYRNVGIDQPATTGGAGKFFLTMFGALKAPFCLHKGDVLVLQYKIRKYYTYLCNIAHMRGCKVITVVHDLSSFYRDHTTLPQEVKRLNHSDYLIVHNDIMKQCLIDNGCKSPIGVLGIFDYLSGSEPVEREQGKPPYKVVYAGTLSQKKNEFLYKLEDYIKSYSFVLYGGGFDETQITKKEHFTYKGYVSSDKLVENAGGDFGLVWDGSSITTCEGKRGEYMRINNPHKFSLYLRCGLPVIIWKEAAMAKFAVENNVGVCVGSLTELDDVLAAISPEQYQEMKKNVDRIGKQLAEGYYFKTALAEGLKELGFAEPM